MWWPKKKSDEADEVRKEIDEQKRKAQEAKRKLDKALRELQGVTDDVAEGFK